MFFCGLGLFILVASIIGATQYKWGSWISVVTSSIAFIFLIMAYGSKDTEEFMVDTVIALVFIAVSALIIFIKVKRFINDKKKNERVLEEKTIHDNKIKFYNECASKGIKDCSDDVVKQKATLIADKYKLKYSNIIDLFNEAKSLVEKDQEDTQKEKFERQKNAEKSELEKLDKYANLIGLEKSIAYCEDLIKGDEVQLYLVNAKVKHNKSVYSSAYQKEHDWATLGGIANGIAGPAAGVATALDVQSKNAQIRQQNNIIATNEMNSFIRTSSEKSSLEKRIELHKKSLENVKTKVVLQTSTADCWKNISISAGEISISETGTCSITATAKLKESIVVYENVPGIIDGTIIAHIIDENGKEVGTANLVIPFIGLRTTNDTILKGMCLCCCKQNNKYSLEFEPKNLWVIEE